MMRDARNWLSRNLQTTQDLINLRTHADKPGPSHTAYIMQTCLYKFDPLKPPLIYSKTGVDRGIDIFFLFLLKNIDCGYSLEPLRRGGSNEYPQSMF